MARHLGELGVRRKHRDRMHGFDVLEDLAPLVTTPGRLEQDSVDLEPRGLVDLFEDLLVVRLVLVELEVAGTPDEDVVEVILQLVVQDSCEFFLRQEPEVDERLAERRIVPLLFEERLSKLRNRQDTAANQALSDPPCALPVGVHQPDMTLVEVDESGLEGVDYLQDAAHLGDRQGLEDVRQVDVV